MTAIGVDGCRAGWIAVEIDPAGSSCFRIGGDIAALRLPEAAMVYIDIPIGLPESGERGCDRAARKMLPGAASRVFLGLRRPLLAHCHDYRSANLWARSDGKGLSRQAFGILPKIAEVDAAISPQRQRTWRESHPELVFCRLNEGQPLASKHTPKGLAERRTIILQHGLDEIDLWLGALRRSAAKPDDLLDACVLALAAREAIEGRARRVESPMASDAKGLSMAIWY
jgi:predicted RNase H-like nuclease